MGAFPLTFVCVVVLAVGGAQGPVLDEGFEKGFERWTLFNAKPPQARLSLSDDAAEGRHALRIETTGRRRNEGATLRLKGLDRDQSYVFSARVKGSGCCRLFAFDGKWTYGGPVQMTDAWKELRIRKHVASPSLSIHVVSDAKHKPGGALLLVDSVRVAKLEIASLADSEVRPVVLEAEDYVETGKHVKVVEDRSASGGRYVEGSIRWIYLLRDAPFPQTTRPVSLYARLWLSEAEKTDVAVYALHTTHGRLRTDKAKEWVWVRCDQPLHARRVGEVFRLTPSSDLERVVSRLDAVVLATDDSLTTAQLDALIQDRRASEGGRVMIGRTKNPPAIDGRLEDACWGSCVALSPFTVRGQERRGVAYFPEEQTRALMTYDAEYLYVGVKCRQDVLDPQNNQLAAFRKETLTPDEDSIYHDDAVLVLLDTNRDREGFFNFVVNGAGVLLDEHCPPDAPWRKRDKSWQSRAEVKAEIGDGFWSIELRIPFGTLGVRPLAGDQWGFNIGRLKTVPNSRPQCSTWQPMEGGFHNAKEFGILEFAESSLGVEPPALNGLQPGKNVFSFGMRLPAKDATALVRVGVETSDESGQPTGRVREISLGDSALKRVDVTHAISAEGRLGFRFFVENPADLSRLVQSPRYLMRVESSALTVEAAASSSYTIFLNGDAIAKSNGGKTSRSRPLNRGINTIAVETTDPKIRVTCKVGNWEVGLDDSWRVAGEGAKGWNRPDFDDSAWSQWGEQTPNGTRLLMRKNVLFKQSKIWPPNDGLHLAVDSATPFWHRLDGIPGRTLSGYRFCLELPEGAELAGATAFHAVKSCAHMVKEIEESRTQRNGKSYTRYAIAFDKPIYALTEKKKRAYYSHCQLAVLIDRDLGPDAEFLYYIETDRFQEIPNVEKIVSYPPLRGKTPRRLAFCCWGGSEMSGRSPQLEEAIARTVSRCGFAYYICNRSYADRWGLKVYRPGAEYALSLMALDRLVPELQRRDETGNRVRVVGWCPSILEDERALDFMRKAYARNYAGHRYDRVMWDLECNPFSGRATCFCRDCLARFRAFAKLPKTIKLDEKIIEADYRQQWIDFMCRQTARTARVMRQIIKERNPGTEFEVYSAYQSPVNKAHYSIDWRLIAPHVDAAACGYGRNPGEIRATLDALEPHGVPLLGGLLVDCAYESMKPPRPHQTRKVEVIRRVLDCKGGVFFYTTNRGTDARTFHAFAETTRFLADHEPFFLNRESDLEFVAEKNLCEEDCVVLRRGGRRLVLLLNESPETRRAKIRLTRKTAKVFDYYQGENIKPDAEQRIELNIGAWDFRALLCE